MGKYLRKAKIAGEVAVMEVAHQSTLGVRTRARTQALQRLQQPSSPTPDARYPAADLDDGSYLQLRSRRLEKPPVAVSKPGHASKNAPDHAAPNKPRLAACAADSECVAPATAAKGCTKKGESALEVSPANDGVEASFGENIPDFDQGDRNVRETTPCSLIRDPDSVRTPGSSTRPKTACNRRMRSSTNRSIPTTDEMEEFFAGAEMLQQRIFTEKYNFDPVNDCPLPGRYEWVRLDS